MAIHPLLDKVAKFLAATVLCFCGNEFRQQFLLFDKCEQVFHTNDLRAELVVPRLAEGPKSGGFRVGGFAAFLAIAEKVVTVQSSPGIRFADSLLPVWARFVF